MKRGSQNGFTLIELVMVIIIIGVLAGVAMKSMDSAIQTGRIESTKKEMEHLADAIAGNPALVSNGVRSDFGYVGDVGSLPPNLDALMNCPTGYTTWNGPYIRNSFSQSSEDYKRDGWNVQYAYSGGVSIASTGSGSTITKQFANTAADLTNNSIQGVILDAGGNPPGAMSNDVDIIITYPNGSGSATTAAVNPSPNGNYSFSAIPIGTRTIIAVNTPTNDTLISYVTVLPRSTIINNMKFGSPIWLASGAASGNSLQYSPGSASLQGNSNIQFDIINNTGANVTISWLNASYSHSPDAWYQEVRWAGAEVAGTTNHRYGSDTQVDFTGARTINNSTTVTLQLRTFVDKENGAASAVNMAGTTFTITFSDGSIITFSV